MEKLKDFPMTRKPTYKELEHGIKELKQESAERKRVDEELNRVFAALKSAPSGVIITDRKGSIKYANPANPKKRLQVNV
jgi:PAS domain-containing protein